MPRSLSSASTTHDSVSNELTAEAIAAYERSLELNPDNTNGRAVLDRLRRE